MPWFRDMPVVVFFFALGLVLLLAAGGLGMAVWTGRIAGALRGRTPVPVNALTAGYHLVRGQASGPMLTAPLSGRPCVWWEVRVWERVIVTHHDSDSSRDRRAEWTERRHDHSSRVIQCTQGFAACAVQPSGTTLNLPTEVRDWQGMQYPPEQRDPPAQPGTAFLANASNDPGYAIVGGKLRGDRYRYREEIIVPNSQLFVLGRAERVDPAQWTEDIEEPPVDPTLLDESRDTATSAPGEAPEPDEDSPPDTDFEPQPWSEKADRQHAADMRQAQWQIGPQKGQPYIVAVQPPEQWLGMTQQASKGGWIMGSLFAALTVFLLWARYGAA